VLLDQEGNPTTNPNALLEGGALVPFGAHKGSGLSIFSALLNQVLVNVPAYADENGQSAAFFLAIDSAIFRPRTDVERDADAVFQKIKSVLPAAGHTAVCAREYPWPKIRGTRSARPPRSLAWTCQ
jgi:LDH2 family malate/lactate/ureidoglycolate dehydrogenase